ncbi:MAG: peptidoglycan-binding protein [Candidatus Altimarinota bacterium]
MSEVQKQLSSEPTKAQDFNSLVDYISADKRINGKDKQAIDELVALYQTEKEGHIKNTKTEVVQLLQESLDKGYTVYNQDDYAVLGKIIHLMNPSYQLPPFEDLIALREKQYVSNSDVNEKKFPRHFSVTYNPQEHMLQLYAPQQYLQHITSNTDLLGKFSLVSGQFIEKTFGDRFQFDDDTQNNNEIDLQGVKLADAPTPLPSIPGLQEAIDGLGQYKSIDEMSADAIKASLPKESTKTSGEQVSPTAKPAVEPTKAPAAKESVKTSGEKVSPTAKSEPTKAPEQVKLTPEQEAIQYNKAKHTPEQIKDIQKNLGVEVDGKVGTKTIDAIKAFQALHGLKIDGKVGPITSKQLESFKETAPTNSVSELPKVEIPEQKTPPTVVVEDGREVIIEDKGTPLSKNDESGQQIIRDMLHKGVNVQSETSYKKFAEMAGVQLPDWGNLPKEITQPKEGEKLTLALSDSGVNIYFGEVRQNESGQQYIMKYGEIVGGKFEKASFFGKAFAFDDIANNANLD